jgi:very-short-patch-repair endonuclease
LVIEVDGDIHDLQQEEDARREKVLREMGYGLVLSLSKHCPLWE